MSTVPVRIYDAVNVIDFVLDKVFDGNDFVFEGGMGVVDPRVDDGYGSARSVNAVVMETVQVPYRRGEWAVCSQLGLVKVGAVGGKGSLGFLWSRKKIQWNYTHFGTSYFVFRSSK